MSLKRGLVVLLLFGVAGQIQMAIAQSPDKFTPIGSMTTPRVFHTATLLHDGRVLITGGNIAGGDNRSTNSAELYDPSTGAFSPTGSMARGRALHTATLLANGKILIAGGTFGNNASPNSAELYDPSTGTFTTIADMAAAHSLATLLNNGKVLMSGGVPLSTANAELFDPATGSFTAAGDYATPAGLLTATLLADGRVLIAGCGPSCGFDGNADVAQLYDPLTNTFSSTGSIVALSGRTETLLTNGKVLFAGGESDSSWSAKAQLYDPSTGAFTRTGDMTKARDNHTATLISDGTVLIAGGRLDDGPPPCCVTHQTAEVYDPATGTLGAAISMTARRGYHTATLLNDGRVLLAGGVYIDTRDTRALQAPPNILASAEMYTPPNLVPTAALLSLAGDGRGQGAIQHADTGQIVSADNPATAGEVIVINCTGFLDGSIVPPQIAVGGRAAEILSFGTAPGETGLNQVTVHVPSGLAPGSAVPVRMNYLGRPSNEVTIGVQ